MAVHTPLGDDIRRLLGGSAQRRVLMLDVVEELEGLTGSSGPEAAWADKALGELDWLGQRVMSQIWTAVPRRSTMETQTTRRGLPPGPIGGRHDRSAP